MKNKKKWWSHPEPDVGDLIKVRPYSKIKKGYGENVGLVVAKAAADYVVMWFRDWDRDFDQSEIWKFKRYEIKTIQKAKGKNKCRG